MTKMLVIWGVPMGLAAWWAIDTGQLAGVVASAGTIAWLTIWGIALREAE